MKLPKELTEMLERFNRVAIVGGPGTGKTALSELVGDRTVYHTDDFMAMGWKEQPLAILQMLEDAPERYLLEGVQVARTLRKAAELGKPCPAEGAIFLTHTFKPLTSRQMGMSKSVRTVFDEWLGTKEGVEALTVFLWLG